MTEDELKKDRIERPPADPPREEFVEDPDGNKVWIGTCGCGLTPEEHVAMSPEDRRIHKTIPPKTRRSR